VCCYFVRRMPDEVREPTETLAWLQHSQELDGLNRETAGEKAHAHLAALKREHHIMTTTSSLRRFATATCEHSDVVGFDSSASEENGNRVPERLHHTLEARVFESVAVMVRDAVQTAFEKTMIELRVMAAEIQSLRTAAFSPAAAVGLNNTNSAATSLQELLEGLQRIMEDIRKQLLSIEATDATQRHGSVAKCPAAEGHLGVLPLQTRQSEGAPSVPNDLQSPSRMMRHDRTLENSAAESTASTVTQAESNGGSFVLDSTLSPMVPACSHDRSTSAAMGSAAISSQAVVSLLARSSSSHKTLAFPQCMDQHGSQSVQFLGTARSSHGSSGSSARGRPSGASAPAPPGDAAGRRLGGSLTPHSSGRMTWADRRGLTLAEQMAGD